MRCISLWQPWATAWAMGVKKNETRHWYTPFRGQLLIHAAARKNKGELAEFNTDPRWLAALNPHRPFTLTFGAIVGVVNITAVQHSESFTPSELRGTGLFFEGMMGDYSPGRYAWCGVNHRLFKTPVPYKGHQGFFDVPAEVVAVQLAEARAA